MFFYLFFKILFIIFFFYMHMWLFRYDKHVFLGLLSWLISLNSYFMANTDTDRHCQQS